MPQDSSQAKNGSDRPGWMGYLQIAIITVVIVAALYLARAPAEVEIAENLVLTEPVKPVVRVLQPEPVTQALDLDLTGTVTLKERVTLISEVVGRIAWVSPRFEPGAIIEADEVFISIDPREYELMVEDARLELAERQTVLDSMIAKGEDPAPYSIALERSRVSLQLAELQLARTEISMPYRFRVISSSAEIGELAGTVDETGRSSVLGLAYRPESIRLDVPIEMYEIESLQPIAGRRAEVRIGSNLFHAIVTGTSAILAPKSRLASLFLKFDEAIPAEELPLPNSFAEVTLAGPELSEVFVLPESTERPYGHAWLVRDGVIEPVRTEILGRTMDGLVVSKFDTGEGIVVDALPNVRSGLAVTAVPIGH